MCGRCRNHPWEHHEGSVVAVKSHGDLYTIGYIASCGCEWQSTDMRDRQSAALIDLQRHLTTVRQEATQ